MKAVAIPYVIALILGVAVIALIGIWFVTSGGKFGSQSAVTLCDNKFLAFCVTNPSGEWTDFTKSESGCSGVSHSFNQCSQVFGISGGQTPKDEKAPASTAQPQGGGTTGGIREIALGQVCGTPSIPDSASSGCNPTPGTKCASGVCRVAALSGKEGCFCAN